MLARAAIAAIAIAATGALLARAGAVPTVGEMFDLAYCQAWARAQDSLTERAKVIRLLFPEEERWQTVVAVMDLGECPRSKPRIAGGSHGG
jgi:hypothetical protein